MDEDVMASLHELNKSATTLPSPITPRVKVFGSSLEGFEDVPSGLLEKEMESTEERQIGKKLGGYMVTDRDIWSRRGISARCGRPYP